jgi:hypothetical protein
MRRILLVGLLALACSDPTRDAEIAALGPEDPNVQQGPEHRPGQPCLLCHDNFSMAGTVYYEDLTTPFPGATVALIDAVGSQFQATTNGAGNFIIRKSDWMPVFPIGTYTDDAGNAVFGVTIIDPNNSSNNAQMVTQIGRDGSCGSCHVGTSKSASSPGHIYLTETPP